MQRADDKKEEKKDEKKEDKTTAAEYGKRAANKARADAKEFKGALAFRNDAFNEGPIPKAINGFRDGLKAGLGELGLPADEKFQAEQKAMMVACEDLRHGLQRKQQELVRGRGYDEKAWQKECKTACEAIEARFDKIKSFAGSDEQKAAIDEMKAEKIKELKEAVEDKAIKSELKSLDRSLDMHRTVASSSQMGYTEAKRLGYYALSALSDDEKKALEAKNIKDTLEVFHPLGVPYEEQKDDDQEALNAELRGVDLNNKLMDQIRLLNETVHGKRGEPVLFESKGFEGAKFVLNQDGSIRTIPPGDKCKNIGGAMDMLLLTGAQSFVLKIPNPENIKTRYGVEKILDIMKMARDDKSRALVLDSNMTMRLHELRQEAIEADKRLTIIGKTVGKFVKLIFFSKVLRPERTVKGHVIKERTTSPMIESIDEILAIQADLQKQQRDAQKAQKGRLKENDAREEQVQADINKLKVREDKGGLIKPPQDLEAADAKAAALSSGPRAVVKFAAEELLRRPPNIEVKDPAKVMQSLDQIATQLTSVETELKAAKESKASIDQQITYLKELAKDHPQDGILHGNFVAKLSEKSEYLARQLNDLELRAQGWQHVLAEDMKPVLGASPDAQNKATQLEQRAKQLEDSVKTAKADNAKLLEPATTAGSLRHSEKEIERLATPVSDAKQEMKQRNP